MPELVVGSFGFEGFVVVVVPVAVDVSIAVVAAGARPVVAAVPLVVVPVLAVPIVERVVLVGEVVAVSFVAGPIADAERIAVAAVPFVVAVVLHRTPDFERQHIAVVVARQSSRASLYSRCWSTRLLGGLEPRAGPLLGLMAVAKRVLVVVPVVPQPPVADAGPQKSWTAALANLRQRAIAE